MLAAASRGVEGHVSPGFEAVRAAFQENFDRRGELGGACCACGPPPSHPGTVLS